MDLRQWSSDEESDKMKKHSCMRACNACYQRGSSDSFKKCFLCQAVFYCSEKCQKIDWTQTSMEAHAHKLWCSKMKEYLAKEEELSQFPFSFTKKTTSPEFDDEACSTFLKSRNLYNRGLWKRENTAWMTPGLFVMYGEIDDGEQFILPECSNIDCLPDIPVDPLQPLASWQQYYSWRKFEMDSPVAIILHYPLTLYYILTSRLKIDYPNFNNPTLGPGTEVNIDCVGVEKEVDILLTFQELGNLLHGIKVNLRMIGKEISKKVHNKTVSFGNISISIHRKLYHKFEGTPPHIVVGFNAGLGAYYTWCETLKKLKARNIPTYFTDYCQYSCELSNSAMKGLGLGRISPLTINPFRSPIRKYSEENCMPWYSNGFIFHLEYD